VEWRPRARHHERWNLLVLASDLKKRKSDSSNPSAMVHIKRVRERELTIDRGVEEESSSTWAVELIVMGCRGRRSSAHRRSFGQTSRGASRG
jgi:hypothetical protein